MCDKIYFPSSVLACNFCTEINLFMCASFWVFSPKFWRGQIVPLAIFLRDNFSCSAGLAQWRGLAQTLRMSLVWISKPVVFLFYIVVYILLSFVAVTILTDVCVICCYFICLVLLSQQYVTCQNFTLNEVRLQMKVPMLINYFMQWINKFIKETF